MQCIFKLNKLLHILNTGVLCLQEALECVRELTTSPSTLHRFVDTAINHVLERSSQARRQTGTLLHDVVSKKIISQEVYLKG